jgi:hypothetical protein
MECGPFPRVQLLPTSSFNEEPVRDGLEKWTHSMIPLHRTARLAAVLLFALGSAYVGVRIAGIGGTPPARLHGKQQLTASKEASTAAVAKPDHVYRVAVPPANPLNFLSATEHTIGQGEVVQFAVTTDRPGFVIVHGLSDMLPLDVKGTTLVSFKAVYSGRFALHFHGSDGAHFELTALNVMPAQASR